MNLQQKYNREEFLEFLKVFLPDFKKPDIRKVDSSGLQKTKDCFTLGESAELDLRIFELKHLSSSDARIALAMDGFRIMKNSATYRALVVYQSEENDDWRLSLMTATPTLNEKSKVKPVLSNPRRFSFFLGPNAKVNTPYQFLIKEGAVKDFANLQKRFSLEVVNKEFYKQISENYLKLVGGTLGSGRNRKTFEPTLRLPSIIPHSQPCMEFAVRLIGRIIFCWFLREKKGSNKAPLMPKELLSLEVVSKYSNYYHQVLEPIFFEVLNKESKSREQTYSNQLFSLIPYLNGGLFSPHDDDFYKRRKGEEQSLYHNTLVVPNQWFINFFEVLETYNFTIDENTTFDEELSIDPEMLGRIFENLLAEINPETGESARKSTGSFYTPRVIVDYMVDESLTLYLKQQTNINETKLRALISYGLKDDEEYPLDEKEKQKVIDAIEKLKLLDPACGSGAFPIGALQKIVFVLQQIDKEGHLWFIKQIKNASPEIKRVIEREFAHRNFNFIRKLGIIRENIFGVDIQPIATEISRLRCFLTLVVDESVDDSLENRGIDPLPNLDFKFVTANSLIGLSIEDEKNIEKQSDMFDNHEKIDELKYIRDQYFTASGIEREKLKTEFVTAQKKLVDQLVREHGYIGITKAKLTQKLTSWEPFSNKSTSWFDPEWMFGINNGFDILIGNPPYGIINKKQNKAESIIISEEEMNYYKNSNYYKPATGGMLNIFRLFILRSIRLLTLNGVFCEIFPLAFIGDLSIANLRKYILDNYQIQLIEAFPERDDENRRVFEAVKMSVCILCLKNVKTSNRFFIRINDNRYINYNAERNYLDKELIKILDAKNMTFPLTSSKETSLLRKIFLTGKRFSAIGKCNTGEIDMTFCKKAFTNNINDSILYKGAIIDRYLLRKKMSQGEIVYINEAILSKIKTINKDLYAKERIVLQGITGVNEKIRLKMMIIKNAYCANSLNYLEIYVDDDVKYYLGLLNSKLLNFVFSKFSTNSNVNGYEVDNLPIPSDKELKQKEFIEKVEKILAITKDDDFLCKIEKQAQVKEYERQIDEMVYKLYDLTEEEIKIVEEC